MVLVIRSMLKFFEAGKENREFTEVQVITVNED
jgi:hypothetical protein